MNLRHCVCATILLLFGSLGSAGCSIATLSGARPIDKGETQVVIAPAFQRIGLSGSAQPGGQLEIGGRYGLTQIPHRNHPRPPI